MRVVHLAGCTPRYRDDPVYLCRCAQTVDFWMNFKHEYALPDHLQHDDGLPRSRRERLLWIKCKVEEGYYDTDRVRLAVAEAFLEPNELRRAGERTWHRSGEEFT